MDKKPNIDDLLNALKSPDFQEKNKGKLENNSDTWRRIGERDNFDELGLGPDELNDFLTQWIKDNPYNNI